MRIASSDSQGKVLFYHGDHLGSSNVLTDHTGELVSLSEYSPFGQTSRQEGTEETAHKYTGQEKDSETRLYYYGRRYYDPQVGVFISPDTIVQDPGDPQFLNRYAYARHNPVKFTDPTGNIAWLAVIGIAALVGATINVAIGFATGAIHNPRDFLVAAGKGAAVGAVGAAAFMGAGALLGATGLNALATGTFLNGLVASAPTGYIANGTGNLLNGQSFNNNAGVAIGASMALFTVGYGIGKVFSKRNPGTAERSRVQNERAGLGENNSPTSQEPSIRVEEGAFGPKEVKLPSEVAETFRGGRYHQKVLQNDVVAPRYFSDRPFGNFLTTEQTVGQIASPSEAQAVLNLKVTGNTAEFLGYFKIPKGTRIFYGRISDGGRRATQIFIEDRTILQRIR